MNRRAFLSRIVHVLSLGIGALLSLPVFRFLKVSLAEEEQASWHLLARTEAMVDEVTQVQYKRVIRDGWLTRVSDDYVWVKRKQDGTLIVFEPHCTHLGCAFAWDAEAREFHCPCHGGKFDADGKRIAGPPPRPLDRYEAKVVDGVLRIGKVTRLG